MITSSNFLNRSLPSLGSSLKSQSSQINQQLRFLTRLRLSTLSNDYATSRSKLILPSIRNSSTANSIRLTNTRLFSTDAANYEKLVASAIQQHLLKELEKNSIDESLDQIKVVVTDKSGGCGTSYEIICESKAFEGKSRLARERLVQAPIMDEIRKWHAVNIRTKVPE